MGILMRIFWILGFVGLLSACQTGTGIDLTNKDNYGLKCSAGPKSTPNWEGCMVSAKRICAPAQVINVKQLNPIGNGSADDGYFMTFTCANSHLTPIPTTNRPSSAAPISEASSTIVK